MLLNPDTELIGKYLVKKQIGKGAFGTVYLGINI